MKIKDIKTVLFNNLGLIILLLICLIFCVSCKHKDLKKVVLIEEPPRKFFGFDSTVLTYKTIDTNTVYVTKTTYLKTVKIRNDYYLRKDKGIIKIGMYDIDKKLVYIDYLSNIVNHTYYINFLRWGYAQANMQFLGYEKVIINKKHLTLRKYLGNDIGLKQSNKEYYYFDEQNHLLLINANWTKFSAINWK
jgi:hypothetical protein